MSTRRRAKLSNPRCAADTQMPTCEMCSTRSGGIVQRAAACIARRGKRASGLKARRNCSSSAKTCRGHIAFGQRSGRAHAYAPELGFGGRPQARRSWARFASARSPRKDARQMQLSVTAGGRAVLREAPEAAQGRLIEALRQMPAAPAFANLRQIVARTGRSARH